MDKNITDKIINIYKTKHKDYLQYIEFRIGDSEAAWDLLHDVFFKILRRDEVLSEVENLSGFVLRSIKNKIIDWYRNKKNDRNINLSMYTPFRNANSIEENSNSILEDVTFSYCEEVYKINYYDSNFEEFTLHELEDDVQNVIDRLPAEQRDAYLENKIEGKLFDEIAAETKVSINTAIARDYYARRKIQKFLKEKYGDELMEIYDNSETKREKKGYRKLIEGGENG